jgi:hypothetical protein
MSIIFILSLVEVPNKSYHDLLGNYLQCMLLKKTKSFIQITKYIDTFVIGINKYRGGEKVGPEHYKVEKIKHQVFPEPFFRSNQGMPYCLSRWRW